MVSLDFNVLVKQQSVPNKYYFGLNPGFTRQFNSTFLNEVFGAYNPLNSKLVIRLLLLYKNKI